MGDVLSLIEQAERTIDEKKARELEQRLRKSQFTFDDFLDQIQQVRRLGSISSVLGMIPGISPAKLKGLEVDDKAFDRIQAVIHRDDGGRAPPPGYHQREPSPAHRGRLRHDIQTVNQLLTQFRQVQKMMKQLGSGRVPKNPFQMFGNKS